MCNVILSVSFDLQICDHSIPLESLFVARHIAPSAYKVQKPNGKFEGELEIGLKFFPKVSIEIIYRIITSTNLHISDDDKLGFW